MREFWINTITQEIHFGELKGADGNVRVIERAPAYAAAYAARNAILAAMSALDWRSPAYRDCQEALSKLSETWGLGKDWPEP